MIFERLEEPGLSQYAYAVGCQAAGCIAIVDPMRDIDCYLDYARRHGVKITHVLETHIHADYASGARELAEKTGAALCLSRYDTGETYEVSFPHQELSDGDTIELGMVRITAIHTPGHTPEHMSFILHDLSRSKEVPMAMLTGDFLFVGSLGRPDLLGKEATDGLARQLYSSVQNLDALPDTIEIHPGHGAGSMCGAGMSGRPMSTLGYERIASPYLDRGLDEDAFVERLLANLPLRPDYYLRMKELNSRGPASIGQLSAGPSIPPEDARDLQEEGHLILDIRNQTDFGRGHIPGSMCIGGGQSFSTWAGWMVPPGTPLILAGPNSREIENAVRGLVRVGLDQVAGHITGGIRAWDEAGLPLARHEVIPSQELQERLAADEDLEILDVRSDREWNEGHIESATHIPLQELPSRINSVAGSTRPVVTICGGGYRSAIAASLLQQAGEAEVIDQLGGMAAWRREGCSTTTRATEASTSRD